MTHRLKCWLGGVAWLLLGAAVLWRGGAVANAANTNYYVDCSATANGTGSQASPWNTLAAVNAATFGSGDAILLKRGTTCAGALNPAGSGASGAPITLDAYGTGALPIISAGANQYAIKLFNQQYWRIQNIETTGGTRYGIFISGNTTSGFLNYFRITNVIVHDVMNGTLDSKDTGLIVITPGVEGNKFNDIVIDGATAYNTNMWAGIEVGKGTGADAWAPDQTKRSTNVTIRNSTVHDVYGDGIVMWVVNTGLMENNVVYKSGLQPTQTIGTPDGIWEWACKDCTVQLNESYNNKSPGVDGGGFDIDYFNDNNVLQYNYGHDNQSYCMSIFGAGGYTTTNAVLRYNVCSNNGGREVEIDTWNNGAIDGVQIYNNTFYTAQGVFGGSATWAGSLPRFFKNNLVYSTNSNPLGSSPSVVTRDYNLYYYTGGSYTSGEAHSVHNANPLLNDPTYHAAGRPTTAFALQSGSPAINAGTDVCSGISGCSMGARDFSGNAILQSGAYDIGANESSFSGGGSGSVTVDDRATGSGQNQFNYAGSGWASCDSCAPGAYNSSNSWSTTANDTVTVAFNGTQIKFYGVQDPGHGIGAVSIDGGSETMVDFYAASRSGNVLMWTSPALASGSHTFKLRVTGTKNASSANYYVVPDRVDIVAGASSTNLISNPGFESGAFSPWTSWPTSMGAVVAAQAHGGTYAARVTGSSAGISLIGFSGLSPSTTYTFRGWLKASAAGNSGYIYAKNFGGAEVQSAPVSGTTYTQVTITFTTGASNTTAEVGMWRNANSGTGDMYADDFELFK